MYNKNKILLIKEPPLLCNPDESPKLQFEKLKLESEGP